MVKQSASFSLNSREAYFAGRPQWYDTEKRATLHE